MALNLNDPGAIDYSSERKLALVIDEEGSARYVEAASAPELLGVITSFFRRQAWPAHRRHKAQSRSTRC